MASVTPHTKQARNYQCCDWNNVSYDGALALKRGPDVRQDARGAHIHIGPDKAETLGHRFHIDDPGRGPTS